jgi:hypothetical protein
MPAWNRRWAIQSRGRSTGRDWIAHRQWVRSGPANLPQPGSVAGMFFKAFCILAVIFVGIGLVGIAIRRGRGR